MTPVPKEPEAAVLALEGREVRVTHPDKLYFSRQARLTKLDLVRYFLSIAPGALAGIRDRPLVLKRFVDGADGAPFYQKRAPSAHPEWLRTATLAFPSGRTAEEVVVDDVAGLAFVVNLGCIELRLLDAGRRIPARHGLSAGGRWIRTSGSVPQQAL
jgi:DNA primase